MLRRLFRFIFKNEKKKEQIVDNAEEKKQIGELEKEEVTIMHINEYTPDPICCVCYRKFSWISGKLCKYCKQPVCDAHIIPEKHNCPGHPINTHSYGGVGMNGYIYGKI